MAALKAPDGQAFDAVELLPKALPASDAFVSPLAGRANERVLPHPTAVAMDPAPGVRGASTAAELVELYWMALLRDVALAELPQHPMFPTALDDLRTAFGAALASDVNADPGKLQLGVDLPTSNNALNLVPGTLFRCGLPGEEIGPIISQFFLRPVPYGAQMIDQRQRPYAANREYLTSYDDWLYTQGSGKDRSGNSYQKSRPGLEPGVRPILTMRDMATFVNQDALHQAYFNAALILLADSGHYPLGERIPLRQETAMRQKGFATFGGPALLTQVSEVAARALKVVWYQKWQVHRRQRPEAYAGRIQMEQVGVGGEKQSYGLSNVVLNSKASQNILGKFGTHFLPMPFPAGSPTHPAYGAGHATVAGACVTVLKAWFQDKEIANPVDLISPEAYAMDFARAGMMPGYGLPPLQGAKPTVWGELNKIACNVAMGRSMGGVHYRSDNTRSLRLGEKLAIVFLARELRDSIERVGPAPSKDAEYAFQSFDRDIIRINSTGVYVNGGSAPDSYFAAFLN